MTLDFGDMSSEILRFVNIVIVRVFCWDNRGHLTSFKVAPPPSVNRKGVLYSPASARCGGFGWRREVLLAAGRSSIFMSEFYIIGRVLYVLRVLYL